MTTSVIAQSIADDHRPRPEQLRGYMFEVSTFEYRRTVRSERERVPPYQRDSGEAPVE